MLKGNISVVIINYNGEKFAEKLINSLNSQTEEYGEVIIIDNNSKDASFFYFLEKLKNVTLFRLSENKGFGYAVNLGVKQAKFENILLLNNDTFIENDFIEKSLKNISNFKGYSFFAPLVLNYDGTYVDSAGDSVGKFLRPYKNFHKKEYKNLKLENSEVNGFSMSICYFVKDDFIKEGMVDEKFFMYFEDVDFSLRLKRKKRKILFTPDTVGYHFISASTKIENRMSEYSSKKVFWEGRNRVFLFFKNYNLYSIKDLFFFLIGTLISSYFHLFKTKKFFWFVKGLFEGFFDLKGIKKYG